LTLKLYKYYTSIVKKVNIPLIASTLLFVEFHVDRALQGNPEWVTEWWVDRIGVFDESGGIKREYCREFAEQL